MTKCSLDGTHVTLLPGIILISNREHQMSPGSSHRQDGVSAGSGSKKKGSISPTLSMATCAPRAAAESSLSYCPEADIQCCSLSHCPLPPCPRGLSQGNLQNSGLQEWGVLNVRVHCKCQLGEPIAPSSAIKYRSQGSGRCLYKHALCF